MILRVSHICKQFNGTTVLDDLSFDLAEGHILAVTGHNGAGKTTLLRIVAGLISPDSGIVRIGPDLTPTAAHHLVGYLPEERGLYRNMKAGEQVVYLARLKGLRRHEAEASARQWFERMGIADRWNAPITRLSKGVQQRVQFAAAVVHSPRLLILDEPFSGFDREGSDMLFSQLHALRSQGVGLLLSTHNREAVDRMADKEVRL